MFGSLQFFCLFYANVVMATVNSAKEPVTLKKSASLADAIRGKKKREEAQQRFSLHARVPTRSTFDFVRAPQSKVCFHSYYNNSYLFCHRRIYVHLFVGGYQVKDAEKTRGRTLTSDKSTARQNLKRKLQEMRRPVRKNVRAVSMSIEGRGV